MIPVGWYLILGAVLFLIGVLGFFIKRNMIALLLSIEIMLNAVNLTFVAFSAQHAQISGQVFVFFVLVVAASEAARTPLRPPPTTSVSTCRCRCSA